MVFAFGAVSLLFAAEPTAPVRLWEETLTLPTYEVAPADPNPRFYQGRTYQGARATFYPYPVMDKLTDQKVDRGYRAVFLENEFIKVSVLPELGGRIFSATDKSNGYDFFYRQHVIKPALIGMLGAWISGGVEWNVPHHHRASSFMPVDFTCRTNADGSKTVWVGETELRHGLKWLVGLTLFPDRNFIEMTMRVFNPTPMSHPILFWINPAVHANEHYQVLFPPGTEWTVQHGKPEFASWPVAKQIYGGTDYTRGVDISWWKNHPSPVSFFAWKCEEDWFGGYDHGKQAGVLQWSDHHMAPGKKFFEWGNGPEGAMWTDILSDSDGPYLELMAGAWSDNQPDYSWLEPGQTREWKHWWYPIRGLGGVKLANRDAALNLEITNGVAQIALNSTKPFDSSRLFVQANSKTIFEKRIDLDPLRSLHEEVLLERNVVPEQVRVTVQSRTGEEILAYQPAKPKGSPRPKAVERPKSPKDYASSDELYYTGQRIEQLYSPAFEPSPYYLEILARDPGDCRANTAMGILACRQWDWAQAARYLSNALARATANDVRPKDGEAFYYLGLALENTGATEAAVDAYQRAAWTPGWAGPAFQELAQIDSQRGRYDDASDHLERCLALRARDPQALAFKTTLLRRRAHLLEATELAKSILEIDPLSARSWNELYLCQRQMGLVSEANQTQEHLQTVTRGEPQSILELGLGYAAEGFWDEATQVLHQAKTVGAMSPMLLYARAFFDTQLGRSVDAKKTYALAAKLDPGFCFPSRYQEVVVLRHALEQDPTDARAAYYLGNAYYDRQPELAIGFWEKARDGEPKLALVHRNLGLAYAQHGHDVPKAITSLEKAVELDPKNARLLYELDVQYEAAGTALRTRLNRLIESRDAVEQRDDAMTRFIVLLIADGHAQDALRFLRERHFHNWEGSGELHDVYVNACLVAGRQYLAGGEPALALEKFQAALEYPRNQEVGKPVHPRRVSEIYYEIGEAQRVLGASDLATTAYQQASAAADSGLSEGFYYRALALQKVGKAEEASRLFDNLVRSGRKQLDRNSESTDYFAKFGEKRAERLRLAQGHFLVGLGLLGQGDKGAGACFVKAWELNPAHTGALSMQAASGQ